MKGQDSLFHHSELAFPDPFFQFVHLSGRVPRLGGEVRSPCRRQRAEHGHTAQTGDRTAAVRLISLLTEHSQLKSVTHKTTPAIMTVQTQTSTEFA